MSKVVYYSSRQKVMEVLATAPIIAFTKVDLSTFVPDGATAIIAQVEIESTILLGVGEQAAMNVRKNAAQGICCLVQVGRLANPAEPISDNAIVPITTDRDFEYELIGATAPGKINIRIYVLGYLV